MHHAPLEVVTARRGGGAHGEGESVHLTGHYRLVAGDHHPVGAPQGVVLRGLRTQPEQGVLGPCGGGGVLEGEGHLILSPALHGGGHRLAHELRVVGGVGADRSLGHHLPVEGVQVALGQQLAGGNVEVLLVHPPEVVGGRAGGRVQPPDALPVRIVPVLLGERAGTRSGYL